MVSMINMSSNKKISENFRAMGTDISVEIIFSDSVGMDSGAVKAIAEVKNIFAKNEKIFSRFQEDSELSKINKNLNTEINVSREMMEVLELCLKFYEISNGYFDPRIIENLERIGYDKDFKSNDFNKDEETDIKLEKMERNLAEDLILSASRRTSKSIAILRKKMDTTGIAKGYTVDEAAEHLKKQGFKNFVVDAGGDMFAEGYDVEEKDWKIGIEGLENGKLMLKLNNEGIATSGISRKRWIVGNKKFHHLINPKDPENFSFDIKTVTVINNKTVEADGRAKTLVLMGKEKGLRFANENNLKALFLDYKGNVYLSEAMKECVIK